MHGVPSFRSPLILSLALLSGVARADYVAIPNFPTVDPALAADHYFERVQFSILDTIYPGNPVSNSGSYTNPADVSTVTTVPILTQAASGDLGAAFGDESTIARGTVFGSVGFGAVKAYAQAYAHAGIARAEVSTTVDMIDKLTVKSSGKPDFLMDISGSASRNYQDALDYANSYGSADLYAWSTSLGSQPAGQFFQPAIHRHIQIDPGNIRTEITQIDQNARFDEGTTWWFSVRFTAWAVAEIGEGPYWLAPQYPTFEAAADFSHTLTLRIYPDPSTPDFSYTTTGGVDYLAPVPEPATFTLLGAGLLVIVPLRRRRRAA